MGGAQWRVRGNRQRSFYHALAVYDNKPMGRVSNTSWTAWCSNPDGTISNHPDSAPVQRGSTNIRE